MPPMRSAYSRVAAANDRKGDCALVRMHIEKCIAPPIDSRLGTDGAILTRTDAGEIPTPLPVRAPQCPVSVDATDTDCAAETYERTTNTRDISVIFGTAEDGSFALLRGPSKLPVPENIPKPTIAPRTCTLPCRDYVGRLTLPPGSTGWRLRREAGIDALSMVRAFRSGDSPRKPSVIFHSWQALNCHQERSYGQRPDSHGRFGRPEGVGWPHPARCGRKFAPTRAANRSTPHS